MAQNHNERNPDPRTPNAWRGDKRQPELGPDRGRQHGQPRDRQTQQQGQQDRQGQRGQPGMDRDKQR